MKMRYVLGILTAFVLAAGLVSALPAGATVTDVNDNGAYSSTVGSTTVTGGHIYVKNVDVTQNTIKWAAIYGNVSGSIVLADSDGADAGNRVYVWSISTPSGYVLATTDSSPTWTSLAAGAASDIDTAWGFSTSDTDSGSNTFTGSNSADYAVAGITIASGSAAEVKTISWDGSTETNFWETDVLKDVATVSAKEDLIFNGYIHNDQKSYENTTADFQILLPVAVGSGAAGTETYNVYVELE